MLLNFQNLNNLKCLHQRKNLILLNLLKRLELCLIYYQHVLVLNNS